MLRKQCAIKYDVVVVGAGIAGLNTARLLARQGKQVCVLEKNSDVGGLISSRMVTVDGATVKLETGGAVVFSHQQSMLRLLNEFPEVQTKRLPHSPTKPAFSTRAETVDFVGLMRKLLDHVQERGREYCHKRTLRQVCLEIMSEDDATCLEACYGYAAEFRVASAWIAARNIQGEVFDAKELLVFPAGYSTLPRAISDRAIEHGARVELNQEVTQVEHFAGFGYFVWCRSATGRISRVCCRQLVLAVPSQVLLDRFSELFTPSETRLLAGVTGVSLTRIFAQYEPKPWIRDLKFSTVHNELRQIIPIRVKMGLLQVSYSDWTYADWWGTRPLSDVGPELATKVAEATPFVLDDTPKALWRYYWPSAIHFWNPGSDTDTKAATCLRNDLFIVGESYSQHQGWAEGAVQTSELVVDQILGDPALS